MRRPAKVLMSLIACALIFGSARNVAIAQTFGDPQRGASMARSVCSGCHGVDPGQRSHNSAAPTFEVIAASIGMTGLALEAALQSTHRLMPNVMLESADRSDVIAYIQSLKPKN